MSARLTALVATAHRIAAASARLIVLALASVLSVAAVAQTGTYNPETPADPATEARLRELSQELRCLVCQNQNIADSNADLAVDLRREVRSQILQGKSDADIKSYLVARYGDFVLYKPPMQGNTALLWFGPLLLLATGGVVWWMLIRRRRERAATSSATVSVDDQQRAKQMLES